MTHSKPLTFTDHDRDRAGMTYVYPVVSRRAGGVSVGINLNTNNACNWRCIYCQVPNLSRGGPEPVDVDRLERELRMLLDDILRGDFMFREVPEDMRRLNDVALSGNGEPTSAREFADVVTRIGRVMADYQLQGIAKPILITNGSLVHRPAVQSGFAHLAQLDGEIWFKLDRATRNGIQTVNQVDVDPEKVFRNLKTASELCPTWLQTCMFALDGAPPPECELDAYLEFLTRIKAEGLPVQGVLLYGLARPSLQPEAPRLTALSSPWLDGLAERIRQSGLRCRVFP